jgi:hypothetical protein
MQVVYRIKRSAIVTWWGEAPNDLAIFAKRAALEQ